ncbi:GlxA family transcriptional regulator [Xanthobacter sp. TB0136]|uniref:GlxA family transcriptional regulator n=1 Tax=Xanthobacter sp. TB0136 TaxID=3459177 RepID=UPI00403A72B1
MDQAHHVRRLFVFYLLPEFTLIAFASAIEALRLANAALGFDAYRWRLASVDGAEVQASCGLTIRCDSDIATERKQTGHADRPYMVVVCGGLNVDRYPVRSVEAWLRECKQNGVSIAGLCTGAHVIASAQLLANRKCVIHWENIPSFVEQFKNASVQAALFEIDGGIHTCAGGAASFDMMLHIIRNDYGEALAASVCDRAIVDRIRNPDESQRPRFSPQIKQHHPAVRRLIERMQETLTDPLSMDELVSDAGLTRRQVERIFRGEVGSSPARFYMRLRLERTKLLLQQTALPIVDIAIANGFSSASHFSKTYRKFYGCSPHEVRLRSARFPIQSESAQDAEDKTQA